MKVKILRIDDDRSVNSVIRKGEQKEMPSVQTNWRFNFNKHIKIKGAATYVLTCEETPEVIEGCLVFLMKDGLIPYMAYVEVAPHNKGAKRKYSHVGSCLIAYACRLSFELGKGDHLGWLTFDVREETEEKQIKLMAKYSLKYKAYKFDETTMFIFPEDGKALINEYLLR